MSKKPVSKPTDPSASVRALQVSDSVPRSAACKLFLDLIGHIKIVEGVLDEIVEALPDGRTATDLAQISESLNDQVLPLWNYTSWSFIDSSPDLEKAMISAGLLTASQASDSPKARATGAPASMDKVITKDGKSLLRLYCIMAQVQQGLKELGDDSELEVERAADLVDNLSGFLDNIAECIDVKAVALPAWKEPDQARTAF